MIEEKTLVATIVRHFRKLGFQVATEVANFHRSADVAAIDLDGRVWVVECKLTSMGRAIRQSRTHKISADRVYICTPRKNTRRSTLDRIRQEGIGLIYVTTEGNVEITLESSTLPDPWLPARTRLRKRIQGET